MSSRVLLQLSRRLFTSVIILFLLISFVFILLRFAPGDITQKFISPKMTPELREKVKESFKLNEGVFVQYASFLKNLSGGNLGVSYNYHEDVADVIINYLPFTLAFGSISLFLQVVFGIFFALLAVKKVDGLLDRFLSNLSLFVYSIPTFIAGVFLIYIFSVQLNLFPSSGLMSFDHYEYSFTGKISDYISHLFLPVITLSFGGVAVYFKYLRDNLEDIYNKPFVLNLRANGFTENVILKRHILPNALNPLISIAAIDLGMLINGALITEAIFGLPGMGRLSLNAILSRDYPLVVGCTFVVGVFVILVNFLSDIIKAVIDKRVVSGVLN